MSIPDNPDRSPFVDSDVLTSRLAQAAQIARDLSRTLRSQRDLLQQRNVTLPLLPIQELSDISAAATALSNRIGVARTLTRELNNLRALARNTELITSTLDLDLILSDVVDTVIALTGGERGYIVLYDAAADTIAFRIARDAGQSDLSADQVTVSQAVIRRAIADRKVIVTSDALGDQRFDTSKSIARLRLISILCVPLIRLGEVTGAIYVDSRMRAGLFDREAQTLVQAFADQAALAIENARLYASVRSGLAEITSLRDLMSNVFESIASGVITVDNDGRVTMLNTAAAYILGTSPVAAVGQPVQNILPLVSDRLRWALTRVRQQRALQFETELTVPVRGDITLNLSFNPLRTDRPSSPSELEDIPQLDAEAVVIVLSDQTDDKRHRAQMNALIRYLPPALIDQIEIYDRSELGGVAREISVLCCDIRGFTRFSETLAPEDLMQIINLYLGLGSDAIHAEGGMIDKYMGDAITGLFNTQINEQADHAERAVHAALRLIGAVERCHADLPPEQRLLFGVGVHTGTAVLGNVGSLNRKEFTAIGETVQFAKLLQENALGGEVLISPDLYAQVASVFDCEALTARKRKSAGELPVLYRVIAQRN